MFNIKEISKCINSNAINVLSETVYKNFIDLKNYSELNHNIKEINRILKSDNFIGFHVYYNSKVIGYILGEVIITSDGRLSLYVNYLYVARAYRHHGLGKKLLLALIDKCEYIGSKFIMLTCNGTNLRLIQFYRKFGFNLDPIQTSIRPYVVLVRY